jgi:hypothetical protein
VNSSLYASSSFPCHLVSDCCLVVPVYSESRREKSPREAESRVSVVPKILAATRLTRSCALLPADRATLRLDLAWPVTGFDSTAVRQSPALSLSLSLSLSPPRHYPPGSACTGLPSRPQSHHQFLFVGKLSTALLFFLPVSYHPSIFELDALLTVSAVNYPINGISVRCEQLPLIADPQDLGFKSTKRGVPAHNRKPAASIHRPIHNKRPPALR